MTTQEQIQFIRQKCVEANPDIVKLQYGCWVKRKDYYVPDLLIHIQSYEDFNDVSICEARNGEYAIANNYRASTQEISDWIIIGRDIRLADVLLAMNGKLGDDTYAIGYHGCTHKPEGQYVLHNWVLTKDRLEEQSPATIELIYNLLK